MAEIRFSARDFILPPYRECPKCGKPGLGILSVNDGSVLRRCRECLITERQPLPQLEKKVLYLDQFVISNLMKALNPKVKSHEQVRADPFWLELFAALDAACAAQLLVCPSSSAHDKESMLSPFYEPLKRLNDHLSGGVAFRDDESIRNLQVFIAAEAWVKGVVPIWEFRPERIVYGRLHGWFERMQIRMKGIYPDYVGQIRDAREAAASELEGVFRRWQTEKDLSFDQRLAKEIDSYIPSLFESIEDSQQRHLRIALGQEPFSLGATLPPPAVATLSAIQDALRRAGISDGDAGSKFGEFLASAIVKTLPFLRIESLMYAVLATQAAGGQKKPPNSGTITDIRVVSSLLPYCDAMLIDAPCAALLSGVPKDRRSQHPTKVFTLHQRDDLLAWLRGLVKDAPAAHLQAVAEVYGEDWAKPYLSIYAAGEDDDNE